ncbi:MAG: T9SS type A sorting domain-containing protein [Saprospiraceae bacterium]|nr:T9SS type A sorting domain-containing protein [Saprospiraceae bacterium]
MRDRVRFFTGSLLLSSFFLIVFSQSLDGQCEIFSEDGYSVQVSLIPTDVITPEDCEFGYNWNVEIAYNIRFLGDNPPANLWTLQGFLYCDGDSSFFNLPLTEDMGDTITVGNLYRAQNDCDVVTLDSLHCDSIVLQIQGPGIPDTMITCTSFGLQCPAGVEISRNDFCVSMVWDSIIPPLTDSIEFDGAVYYYEEGSGTPEDAAVYKSGGGNGACNAQADSLFGDLIIRGDTCTYSEGPVLPVQFIDVSINQIEVATVELAWTVGEEIGVSHYGIEQLIKEEWKPMMEIPTTSSASYHAIAKGLRAGKHFFRIKAIDWDGSSSISKMVTIRLADSERTPIVYPNPIAASQELELLYGNMDDFIVSISSLQGGQSSFHRTSRGVRLDQLPPGLYVVQLTDKESGRTYVQRLQKI